MFLKVKDVNKSYKTGDLTFQALKNVSFAMEEGEIAVILGPSGSGKSTFMNVIGGIDYPDDGEIMVDGVDITKLKSHQITSYRQETVGFIFQFYNLIPNLTVYENVEVAATICESPLDIDVILEAVGMKEYRNRFPRELSGGQQQRVSIARALVKKPKLLLCDEPTGALDYQTSKEILKLIVEMNQHWSSTVLIITHNPGIAEMAHRVVKVRSGEIIENSKNSQVLSPERIEW